VRGAGGESKQVVGDGNGRQNEWSWPRWAKREELRTPAAARLSRKVFVHVGVCM
jgi:hypothetical protein